MKACAPSSLHLEVASPSISRLVTPTPLGTQRSKHLRRPVEPESSIHGFPERRRVQSHPCDSAASSPLDGRVDDSSRMALPAAVGLCEHREKVSDGRALLSGSRLDLHHPDASARNGPRTDLDDEPRELTGTDPRPCPPAVQPIRVIELLRRVLVNRREHLTSMTNEEIEILDRR